MTRRLECGTTTQWQLSSVRQLLCSFMAQNYSCVYDTPNHPVLAESLPKCGTALLQYHYVVSKNNDIQHI